MISSGMKRGLAATAISAMAVTGLPFLATSASANPLDAQVAANAVVLHTPDDLGAASIKNDGVNTTVHLLANAGTGVSQVRFEYGTNVAGPFTAIATVNRTNGAFSTEWTPPVGVYNLPVHVRAVAIDSVGVDGNVDDNVATVTSNQDSIDISNAAGSAIGVFDQPYATVSGLRAAAAAKDLGAASATTSDVAANPAVKFSTPYNATSNDEDVASTPATGATSRSVSGPVDFTGYNWGTLVDADQAVVEANVGGVSGGSDAEAVTVYQQTITTVTAAAVSPTVQGAGTTSAIVTVLDQNGKPVVGAEVFQDDNGDNAGDAAPKYTNSEGKATFPGLGGTTTGTTHTFFVNTTDSVNYDAGSDFKRTVTVTSYTPTATTITASSHDGAAFDFDENAAGDITLTVKDQNGTPKAGENVVGKWTMTAFSNGAVTTASAIIADNGDGTYNVTFPATVEGSYKLDTWIERDGTPGQSAGDLSSAPLNVKSGEANVVWADGVTAQAAAGTTATFNGVIELDDHTALPSRNVSFTWAKNPTGDAVLAAQAAQPTGTTRTSNTVATATADANGKFGVAISDPAANPQLAELDGDLTVNSANTPAYGTNTDASDLLDVDFLADSAVSSTNSSTGQSDLSSVDGATPGRPVQVDITVENAAHTPLTDRAVKITTDHGFFTTPDATTMSGLIPAPAAAEGANYGEWENKGTEYNTTTDDSGSAVAVVAIERDAGFDDNGEVTANVTFTVGGKTFVEPITFDSSDPMNPGEVKIVLDDTQTVTVLPKAPTTETVWFNVFATDQFGNLTDEPIKLDDASSSAKMWDSAPATDVEITNGSTVTSQFTNGTPRFYASAAAASDQTITGLWDNASTLIWKDADPATAGFQEETAVGVDGTDTTKTKDVTGALAPINWYTIDFANSSYTMTHTGADRQPVGAVVTETYKAVDQNGEPMEGLFVTFYRTGPDDLQDGDGNSTGITDSNGETTYVFQGAKAGTATTTAVVRQNAGGPIIPQGQQTDVVKFGAMPIQAILTGSNNGARPDKLTVDAPSQARGAVVRLYKVVNGVRRLVGKSTLNLYGNRTFKVADRNGRAYTKYVAVVSKTARTKADTTNTKRVR